MSNSMPFAEQLLRSVRIDNDTDCWIWISLLDKQGYGRVGVQQRMLAAHRWVFERLVGPIPDGFQLDHLCRNPPCVNPRHLEAVSPTENVIRGIRARKGYDPAIECPNGHPRALYGRRAGVRNARYCTECQRLRAAASRPQMPTRIPCDQCGRLISPWLMFRHRNSKPCQKAVGAA